MQIVFDIVETYPTFTDNMTIDEILLFNRIVDFISGRLSVLKTEIELQERLCPDCIIMIHLLAKIDTERLSIMGYSDDLLLKMKKCFSEEDFEYINNVLIHEWQRMRN
jgi:hypothetical protein